MVFQSGSDWVEIFVFDMIAMRLLPDLSNV